MPGSGRQERIHREAAVAGSSRQGSDLHELGRRQERIHREAAVAGSNRQGSDLHEAGGRYARWKTLEKHDH